VYRRRWERFTDQCVYEFDRFGGGSVMVWAGICHDGRTQLKIIRFLSICFLCAKIIEHQTLVSFLLLTSKKR